MFIDDPKPIPHLSTMPIFDGAILAGSILNTNYLNLIGGRAADRIDHAIHIITNMSQFEGWRKVEDGAVDAAVTTWTNRSIILGKAQPTQFYLENPAMVFSGIVACATGGVISSGVQL
ncbi:hypothetical protein PILCRDRAFT_548097 [Piloderma croceum F 1598]|uniref:Uncharacterized protein n=1 Tax=Piloderma croceum (strain F 1598) TaxID=765440 RepID=A0A0C3F5D3_PILCF|nr:hypothetical protein PILCRDRAFT_548097 [Piloderma croceum F 1598]